MAIVGRKPKPTMLKLIDGNPGKRPIRDDEPKIPEAGLTCPAILKGGSRAEWYRVVKLLSPVGIATAADRAVLTAYCIAWGRLLEAEAHIEADGMVITTSTGYPIQSPWLGIANKSAEHVHKFAVECGMTPSSRSRLTVPRAAEKDDFDDFLQRTG